MNEQNPFYSSFAIAALLLVTMTAVCGADSASERMNCDIQRGPCVRAAGAGTEITLDITPRPVTSMIDLVFSVTVRKNGIPVSGASVLLDLTMPGMIMGRNHPKLSRGKDGRYQGRGVIPHCTSGRKTWKAEVSVTTDQGTETALFLFEVN